MSRPITPDLALRFLEEMTRAMGKELEAVQREPAFLNLVAQSMTRAGLRPPISHGIKAATPAALVNRIDVPEGARVQ